MKKLLFIVVFSLFWGETVAQDPHSLPLYAGKNIIAIGLANESKTAVKSLKVMPDAEKFPNGVLVEETIIPVDFTSETLELRLQIDVDPGHEGTVVALPLILIGDTGHRWYVALPVTIEVRPIAKTELLPNQPNPFNPETTIHYRLAGSERQETQLAIYNIIGQKIRTLVQEYQEPGEYAVRWDGTDDHGQKVSSGIYMYHLTFGDFAQTRRMMLLK